MTISDFEKLLRRDPFQAFAIQTNGGSTIEVTHPHQLAYSHLRQDLVVVFDSAGGFWFLDPGKISAIYAGYKPE
jgi:hypothetical protein